MLTDLFKYILEPSNGCCFMKLKKEKIRSTINSHCVISKPSNLIFLSITSVNMWVKSINLLLVSEIFNLGRKLRASMVE